jgi:hypothetical protein
MATFPRKPPRLAGRCYWVAVAEVGEFSPDLLRQVLEEEAGGLALIGENAFEMAADALGEFLEQAINDDPMDMARDALGELAGQPLNGDPMEVAGDALDEGAEPTIEDDPSGEDALKSFDWDGDDDSDLGLFT